MNRLKMLLFAALLVWSGAARAQAPGYGGLGFNNRTPCEVYVTMMAIDPSSGYGGACSIMSHQVTVPPGSWGWCTVWDFQGPYGCGTSPTGGAVGWNTIPGLSPASTRFNWTDVQFQFGCPDWYLAAGHSNEGGAMSDLMPIPGVNCLPGAMTWVTPPWTGAPYVPINGQWSDVTCPGGCYGNAVLISFW
jgi:hypothetical protein